MFGSRKRRDGVNALYAEARRLADRVGIDPALLPRAEAENREDGLWIETVEDGLFERFYMERGQRVPLGQGDAVDTLFEALLSASATEAGRREVKQRIPGQDTRRQWMAIQRVLMAAMKPEWEARVVAHQTEILAHAPFRDS